MKIRAATVAVALLLCGIAVAQTSPPFDPAAAPTAPPPGMPPPDGQADIWGHLTADQRKELWQRLTPEERAAAWRRLTPAQRQAIRDRLTPEQRRSIREHWAGRPEEFEGRAGPGPGPKLSPEERRSLRGAITDAHRDWKRGRGGRPH